MFLVALLVWGGGWFDNGHITVLLFHRGVQVVVVGFSVFVWMNVVFSSVVFLPDVLQVCMLVEGFQDSSLIPALLMFIMVP